MQLKQSVYNNRKQESNLNWNCNDAIVINNSKLEAKEMK